MRSELNYYIGATLKYQIAVQVKLDDLSANMVTAQQNAYSFYEVDWLLIIISYDYFIFYDYY